MVGYLTPNTLPSDTVCRTFNIPNDPDFIAVVLGALLPLLNPDSWTPFGSLTPAQAAEALQDGYDNFAFGLGSCRMIGEIICYAGATSPDAKWLPCDGASLLRSAYPDLFAIVGTTYGAVDGTHFNLPDLQSRVPLAVGTGSGLSTYALGQTGGEETHTLTTSETPSHSHTDVGHTHAEGIAVPALGAALVGVPIPSAVPAVGVTGIGNANLANTGGGGAHNNIQPYVALTYLIVALP